ncbi:hypothetical protein GDO81_021302 [Engystomops pustulosus]|uniref:Uncharacterized protein n=1 Tax=Engystomops pustulosus TaxID=76066 RepID=A0AAV6YYQ2_ENGPU|nr:hypothetical protein GDO81_021302 [Engystomops pustulosus]
MIESLMIILSFLWGFLLTNHCSPGYNDFLSYMIKYHQRLLIMQYCFLPIFCFSVESSVFFFKLVFYWKQSKSLSLKKKTKRNPIMHWGKSKYRAISWLYITGFSST